jgi:hypothetical protein
MDFREAIKEKDFSDSQKHIILTILNNFDYEKVHRCMLALNWTWASSLSSIRTPSIEEIQTQCFKYMCDIMEKAIESPSVRFRLRTGGFYYEHLGDFFFSMEFVVANREWTWDDIECDKEYKRIKTIENLDI